MSVSIPTVNIWWEWGAAIAPWFRLGLPSCGPGFESQAHHLCFFQFVLLKLYPENNENKQKEAGIGPFFNIWWDQTTNPKIPIASTIVYTIPRTPKGSFYHLLSHNCDVDHTKHWTKLKFKNWVKNIWHFSSLSFDVCNVVILSKAISRCCRLKLKRFA